MIKWPLFNFLHDTNRMISIILCSNKPQYWPLGNLCVLTYAKAAISAVALMRCSMQRSSTTVGLNNNTKQETCWRQHCVLLCFWPQFWFCQHCSQPQEPMFSLLLECELANLTPLSKWSSFHCTRLSYSSLSEEMAIIWFFNHCNPNGRLFPPHTFYFF